MNSESPLALVHRVCAWCGKEFARESWIRDDQAEITTWGICQHCLEPRLDDDGRRKEPRHAATRGNRPPRSES
jgi:hypothetical protein